jgi:hypothetical protein
VILNTALKPLPCRHTTGSVPGDQVILLSYLTCSANRHVHGTLPPPPPSPALAAEVREQRRTLTTLEVQMRDGIQKLAGEGGRE